MHLRQPSRFSRFVKRAMIAGLTLVFCAGAGTTLYLRWQYGELGATLDQERERAKKNGLRLSKEEFTRSVPDDQNAAIEFREAITAYQAFPKKDLEAAAKLAKDLADNDMPVVPGEGWEPLMRLHKTVVPILERAAAKPDCDFGRDWSDPVTLSFPEYSHFRTLGMLLRSRALVHVQAGRHQEAFRDLRTALKLYNYLAKEPVLIASLLRSRGRADVHRNAELALRRMPANSFAGANCLDMILPLLKEPTDPLHVIGGEPFFGVFMARNIKRYAPEFGKIMGNGEDGFNWERFAVLPPFQDSERVGRAYETQLLHYWNGIYENARKENWSPEKIGEELDIRSRSTTEDHLLTKVFFATTLAVYAAVGDHVMADQARTQIAVAVRDALAYRQRMGKYPASLDLATKAVDPYTEGPLSYRRTEDGFVVYSVGKDRKDDGGKRRPRSGPRPADEHHDLVFQVGGAEGKLAEAAPGGA